MSKNQRKWGNDGKQVFAYVQIARLEVDDFLAIMDVLVAAGEGLSKRKKQWVSMILDGKLTCAATDKPVAYLSYDTTNNLFEERRTFHFNFYTEDDELITVDHVYPKSRGGSEMEVDNLQPMVGVHNWKKGSQINYTT